MQALRYRIDPLLQFHALCDVPKVLVYVDPVTDAEYVSLFAKELDGLAGVSRTEPGFVEINALGVTKGTALMHLSDMLGLTREHTVAVGDSYLDIPMLEWAGEGIAVQNAVPAVLNCADRIIPSVWEDGVACYIESLLT